MLSNLGVNLNARFLMFWTSATLLVGKQRIVRFEIHEEKLLCMLASFILTVVNI